MIPNRQLTAEGPESTTPTMQDAVGSQKESVNVSPAQPQRLVFSATGQSASILSEILLACSIAR
jgi:hypothetical protein